ncbi:hypothetical protein [Saccharothrix hoggarensis]|uniref:Integral membrane protein n=1 Tax=Saccharothrix hoggarensis TaxID=913853 RepID=A0ABW3QQJ3_9PSEU
MVEEEVRQRSMPGVVKLVLVVLWFQGVANLFAAFVMATEIISDVDHGRDSFIHIAPSFLTGSVALVLAVLLILCAVRAPRRHRWVRTTVIVIQTVNLVAGVPALFIADPVPALIGMGLAATVLVLLAKSEAQTWFDR